MAISLLLAVGLVLHATAARAQNYPPTPAYAPYPSTSPYSPNTITTPVLPAAQPARTLQFTYETPAAVQPVAAQQGGKDPGKDVPSMKGGLETLEFRNLKEIPGAEVLFRVESEKSLFERMRQESLRANGERLVFPDEPGTKETYAGRHWVPLTKQVEPYFVVHGRLLFEQQNTTRGIWDLGFMTPAVCLGKFYWDALLLPYNLGTRPFQEYDTDAGKCLPGDPSPLFLYPVEFSLTGLLAEGAAVTGAFFVFP
jgi:hypothetical protein